VPDKGKKVADGRSRPTVGRKRSIRLAEEYGDDILTVLRGQWISTGRKNPDFDEFVSGFTIVNQFIEREGRRNLRDKLDMSSADLRILLALARVQTDEGLRPTDLFRHLLVSSGAITKQLDRLESRGLIDRFPDPRNKRGARVVLTKAGEQMVAPIIDSQHRILPNMERMFNDLSEIDRKDMLRMLHILTRSVQETNRISPFD
jgi:DNA-binding MarR family transcriptional regulator